MGIYLSTPKTEKVSEDGENDMLRYGLSSMQGWRSTMEDAHAAHPNLDSSTSFFGVYDGHGGKAVAKFCAKYLHQEFLKHDAYSVGDLGTAIKKAFLRMDEMMCGQSGRKELAILGGKIEIKEDQVRMSESDITTGESDDELSQEELHHDYKGPTFGSTACVAIIHKNQLIVANAGDSRCIISRNGQAYDLSEDHKPDLKAEKERILKAGGFVQHGRVNGTLNLTRAIGDMELKKNESLPPEMQILTANPDVNFVELGNDADFLVLACDGIWDCMSSQQLVDFIKEQLKAGKKLSIVCEKVLDKCLAPASGQEGCDNMTMILVQFKKSSHSDSSKNQPLPSAEKPAVPVPKSQNPAEVESRTQKQAECELK